MDKKKTISTRIVKVISTRKRYGYDKNRKSDIGN